MEELYYLEEAELQMKKMVRTAQFYDDMKILQIREAENRAFMEDGGSFETLCNFYEEAAEEAEKKNNIFKRAWGAILNFCQKIKESFTKKKISETDPNAEIVVNKERRNIRKKLITFFRKWKNSLSHPKTNPKAFIKAIAPLAALVATIAAVKVGKNISGRRKRKKTTVVSAVKTNPTNTASKKEGKKEQPSADKPIKEKVVAESPDEVVVTVKELVKDHEELQEVVIKPLEQAAEEMVTINDDTTDNKEKVLLEQVNTAKSSVSDVLSVTSIQLKEIDDAIEKAVGNLEKK